MSEYQVHVLDEWGRILRTVKVECDGDDQARAVAEDPIGSASTELWQGDRLIERYDPLVTAYPLPVCSPPSRMSLSPVPRKPDAIGEARSFQASGRTRGLLWIDLACRR